MNLFKSKKNNPPFQEINLLEQQLDAVLRPLTPRQEFVDELRTRLMAREIVVDKPVVPRKLSNSILVFGGVFGGLVMLLTSIRGLISLLGIIGLVYQYLARNTRQQTVSV